jgi:hypothetical protein
MLRLERDKLGLQQSIEQYRLALEENARSIIEREAGAKEAEAKLIDAKNLAEMESLSRAEIAEQRVKELEQRLAQAEKQARQSWWQRLWKTGGTAA